MFLLDEGKDECHWEVEIFRYVQRKNSKGRQAADTVKMTFSRDTGLLSAAASAGSLFHEI